MGSVPGSFLVALAWVDSEAHLSCPDVSLGMGAVLGVASGSDLAHLLSCHVACEKVVQFLHRCFGVPPLD